MYLYSHPKASIIIAASDKSRGIEKTFESILRQSYENYEILVIGAENYSHQYSHKKIKYYSKDGLTLPGLRNEGIKRAKGEILFFLETGAFWIHTNVLSQQIRYFMLDHELDVLQSRWKVNNTNDLQTINSLDLKNHTNLDTENLLQYEVFSVSTIAFRRNCVEEAGGFDESLNSCHTFEMALKISLNPSYKGVRNAAYTTSISDICCTNLKEIKAILRFLFNRNDLSQSIKDLEKKSYYEALVWMAWRQYGNDNPMTMSQHLKESLSYTSSSEIESFYDWIDKFIYFASLTSKTLNVGELTSSQVWNELTRVLLSLEQEAIISKSSDSHEFPQTKKISASLEPNHNFQPARINSKGKELRSFVLFTPYYKATSEDRQQELIACLKKNVACKCIKKIYLLIDDNHTPEISSSKIEVIHISLRATYHDWIKFTKTNCYDEISILANSDIYFGQSIENIGIIFKSNPSALVALSRHEINHAGTTSLTPEPYWSQDVWAIQAQSKIPDTLRNSLKIPLGIPRCDNRVAYLFTIHGFRIYNPCSQIKAIHLHNAQVRSYDKKNDLRILGGTAWVYPSGHLEQASRLKIDIYTLTKDEVVETQLNASLANRAVNSSSTESNSTEDDRASSHGKDKFSARKPKSNTEFDEPSSIHQSAYLMVENELLLKQIGQLKEELEFYFLKSLEHSNSQEENAHNDRKQAVNIQYKQEIKRKEKEIRDLKKSQKISSTSLKDITRNFHHIQEDFESSLERVVTAEGRIKEVKRELSLKEEEVKTNQERMKILTKNNSSLQNRNQNLVCALHRLQEEFAEQLLAFREKEESYKIEKSNIEEREIELRKAIERHQHIERTYGRQVIHMKNNNQALLSNLHKLQEDFESQHERFKEKETLLQGLHSLNVVRKQLLAASINM